MVLGCDRQKSAAEIGTREASIPCARSWSVQRDKNFSFGAGGTSRPDLYTKTLCASYVGRSSVSDARSIRRQGGAQHWSRSAFRKNLRVVGSGFYESAIRLRQGV